MSTITEPRFHPLVDEAGLLSFRVSGGAPALTYLSLLVSGGLGGVAVLGAVMVATMFAAASLISPGWGIALLAAGLSLLTVLLGGLGGVGLAFAGLPLGRFLQRSWDTAVVRDGALHLRGRAWHPTGFQLRGRPGQPLELVLIGDHGPQRLIQARSSYRAARELADALAAAFDVPLAEDLDATAWERWDRDPAFRRLCHLQHEVERSRSRFGEWYAIRGNDDQIQHDADGWSVAHLRQDRRGVQLGGRTISGQIEHAEMVLRPSYDERGFTRTPSVHVMFSTADGVHSARIGTARPRTVATAVWVAAQLAAAPSLDRGDADDIPLALQQARRSAALDGS